jgi:hypothetical protein
LQLAQKAYRFLQTKQAGTYKSYSENLAVEKENKPFV